MTFSIFAFLLIAGIGAGLTATLAGLASLVSYPALLAIGVPPVIANVTNTAALVFTGVGSAVSSLPELRGRSKFLWRLILIVSLGSIFGSALLLIAPASTFEKIVPFFIIAAGLLLLFSGKLPTQEHRPGEPVKTLTFRQEAAQTIVIFVTGAYAGYFGAAAGVVMLATLTLTVDQPFIVSNSMKNLTGFAANAIATVIYAFTTKIEWLMVIPLGIGLFIGGYIGPIIARRLPVQLLRVIIAALAFLLAAKLFAQAYL